jgi:hypothetical protein
MYPLAVLYSREMLSEYLFRMEVSWIFRDGSICRYTVYIFQSAIFKLYLPLYLTLQDKKQDDNDNGTV